MLSAQFIRFALVGCVGFIVDALSFALFDSYIHNPYISRLGSYLCAATATWWLNRKYTFDRGHHQSLLKEWFAFLLSQTLGFCVNYGVFSILVACVAFFNAQPILAIAAGSIAGLVVNFSVAKWIVFRHKEDNIR